MPDDTHAQPSEGEWLISTCRECEREIKIRSSVAATEMACPYCSAAIALEAAAHGEQGAPKQKRRSRGGGKVPNKSPEWDRTPGAPSGPDDDDTNEYVEIDPNNPDAVRVRRVRRKRTFTRTEKFVRALTVGFVSVAALGGIAVLIIAMVKGTGTANQDIQTVTKLPDKVQSLIDAAVDTKDIAMVVNNEEKAAVVGIINGFYQAETDAERLPFVRSVNRVSSLMEQWNSKVGLSPIEVEEILLTKKELIDGKFFIMVAAKVKRTDIENPLEETRFFTLQQTTKGILLDWEVSSGYQPIPLKALQERRPTTPVELRVNISRGDYFDGVTFDKENFRCFTLTYMGDDDFKLYGYAKLGSAVEEELSDLLEIRRPAWILKVAYPPDAKSSDQVVIESIAHRSWFYD